jgi:pimeloyl-ACP methyl ester carboxylesterase
MLSREVPRFDPDRPQPGRTVVELPAMSDAGPVDGARCAVSVLEWGVDAGGERLPVVLLHGSPGSARNWDDLGPLLAESGRRVLALDLPGFGRSSPDVPSYSILAHARAVVALLEALGIERAHLATWSMGGGVALHVADLAPERVASIAQIAALGVQEAEGSGSYAFEHLKYGLLWFGLTVVPEGLPHFGALGHYGRGKSFIRNFWDTDQRPLRGIMERLETPTLILHGRDDFLVPAWAAEVSHELVEPSRLVMLDASHFLPLGGEFGQVDQTLEYLAPFLARHDRPGVPAQREFVDLAPPWTGLERFGLAPYMLSRAVPWWLQLAALAGLAWMAPRIVGLSAGLLVGGLQLDFGLALVACWTGVALWAARERPSWPRAALRVGAVGALVLVGVIAGARAPAPVLQWLAAAALALALWRGPRPTQRTSRAATDAVG